MIIEFAVKYSLQVLGGIIILIIGFFMARIASRAVTKFLEKHNIDITVIKFLSRFIKLIILSFSLMIALGNFGISITPFIAGLSVAGFGLTLALQGPLSNYAAGANLIFTKPFKVGDIIEVKEITGEVEDMSLSTTRVISLDGTRFIIPNKHIIGQIIHNFSVYKKVDIKVRVTYLTDVQKGIDALTRIIKADKRISRVPLSKVGISEYSDLGIWIYARIWCKQSDYWDVMFSVNQAVLNSFLSEGVQMPFFAASATPAGK